MEELIEVVKQYPILYNSQHEDYKNIKKKDKVWDEIGDKLGEDGCTLKIKWRNMRDSYTKHLKTFLVCTSGQSAASKNRYRSWQWAQQMEFCKPFLKIAAAEPKLLLKEFTERKYGSDTLASVKEGGEAMSSHGGGGKATRKMRIPYLRSMTYMQAKAKAAGSKAGHDDAVDLLFQGLAKTVKSFSPQRQAFMKLKIANIVLQEEVKQREEESSLLHTPIDGRRLNKTEPEPTGEFRSEVSLHSIPQPGPSPATTDPLNTHLFDV